MDRVGFIGYGSMGRMLVRGLIESGKVRQDRIYVTRKNKDKLGEIKAEWPGINIEQDTTEVIRKADLIFLCMKPMEYKDVLLELKSVISPEQHLVSITAAVKIKDIENIVSCKLTKILPSIISEVKEGITLICHNSKVSGEDKAAVEDLLTGFTELYEVGEEDFGFASEFTSCGPGLYASVLQEFIRAGLRHSDTFTEDELTRMVSRTLCGTARLMLEKDMDFTEVISRVATKGGITEEGVKVVQTGVSAVFDELFEKTLRKRILVDEKVKKQFKEL